MTGLLFQAFVYLTAAVVAVPLARRLGLGSVLGYLLAGIVIGPIAGLVGAETQDIQHFAEFGVVMMLFLVGLELQPAVLWKMRNRLLGLGGLQVGITAALITGAGLLMTLPWTVALAIGLIFSLSSTAIVLQTLNEKGLTQTDGGRASFSILLFQDIAVIPMLALLPLLALPELADSAITGAASDGHHDHTSLVHGLPGWAHALVVVAAVASVLVGGHFLSQPLFRFIAASKMREIFTASALLLVIAIALLMTLVDLSPALGTFLAGVVLANSEFRHELESDIEPFKGLLLGLFFITVGAGINFDILFGDFFTIIGLTIGVMALKGLVLWVLALLFKVKNNDGWLMTLGLAQAGEFGFVLLSFGLASNVIPPSLSGTLSLVVALSMLATPALFIAYEKFLSRTTASASDHEDGDAIEEGAVIIAGSGRFGQIVNRMLMANGVTTVVLDHEVAMIDALGKFGVKAYFGDASRPDLLHAAGIEQASALVVAINDPDKSVQIVDHVKRHHPHVKVLARAYDRYHLYLLRQAGVDVACREMLGSSIELGKEALTLLGMHPFQVEKMARTFKRHDQEGIDALYQFWDKDVELSSNKAYVASAREYGETLQGAMARDRVDLHDSEDRGWNPPPKGYTDNLHSDGGDADGEDGKAVG